MKQTFSYYSNSKSFLKDNIKGLAIGIILVVGPIVYPFGIRIGSTRVLGPVPTVTIFVLLGLYFLFVVFKKYRKARALAAQNCSIIVEDDKITYPIVKKGSVTEGSFANSDISALNYDEEDGILTVSLNNGKSIDFYKDFFESLDRFKEFTELLKD